MAPRKAALKPAIEKLARAGQNAGFTIEEMIELLNTGVSVETLLNLICTRLDSVEEQVFDEFFRPLSKSNKPQ